MRFAIEEINNSTSILPNVTLGYQIFDHCTAVQTFSSSLQLLSRNNSIQARQSYNQHLPNIIGLTGPLTSSESITLAPLFMVDLIPVVSYGASSSVLSEKRVYPSFLRTVPSNKGLIDLIIHIIKYFDWNWVAFLGSGSDYSKDGAQLFYELSQKAGICLGYQEVVSDFSQLKSTFNNIDILNIKVIVLFLAELRAEAIIRLAIEHKFQDKVWIASDSWALYQPLTKLNGIETIGTIIGVTPTVVALPGFAKFIHQSRAEGYGTSRHETADQSHDSFCNQACATCSSMKPDEILIESTAYAFSVYSAVYTMALALHNALQCNHSACNTQQAVYPYKLLEEIKRLPTFSLNQMNVSFNREGDPPAHYSVVLWDTTGAPVKIRHIGTYNDHAAVTLTIDDTQIHWFGDGSVPFSNCSAECQPGHRRQSTGQHACCFLCEECGKNQYVNHTADPYSCLSCKEFEWSNSASTTCQKRSVEYLHYDDAFSILLLLSASLLILLCAGVAVLFFLHRSTPVVRSAGGSMCYLMLSCIAASTASVFFHFGKPTAISCALQNITYTFFYTICMSCLFVRSLQIIAIFKMASHLPRAHALWVKYSGQWLVVAAVSLLELVLCVLWVTVGKPWPENNTWLSADKVILQCAMESYAPFGFSSFLLGIVSILCFIFAYMGTDLPKNYNEAKAITFCILLFYLSWAIFVTTCILQSSFVAHVKVMVHLSSLSSMMVTYFFPKCFIVIFQPHKNTAEFFQAAIQSYTQTISRT
ncbi:taste receptor type 1 member 1-like [Engraulis encrasicolus]|uniref:taste receptor type 1 member 1-like n=1 Tax=Engraulis encrasicolus TaxID=184585 RepID=UPI002FD4A1C9